MATDGDDIDTAGGDDIIADLCQCPDIVKKGHPTPKRYVRHFQIWRRSSLMQTPLAFCVKVNWRILYTCNYPALNSTLSTQIFSAYTEVFQKDFIPTF